MTIGEFSKKTGMSVYTLRYYEDKKLIIVARDEKGRRIYTEKEIEWVQFIKRLKDTGMKLQEIQKYASLRYEGEKTMPQRLKLLKRHYDTVVEQQKKWEMYLQNLGQKILWYEKEIKKGEKKY
ncbi:MerR family transcriptional regulator [Clostridium sp. MD294]|uniref:MerR family transcriptional regulator n=1 Tax=Clostridium sp. MD294 TaxID=97138 RepID=UPI0002C937BD|nr:MerR family transcriptional regulator [Clostridium sp. MD294]USF29876.1 putative HTH-type transcriptional regulator [Clostridium sp. MD294]